MNTVGGSPDLQQVSTSFVERQNLAMRMYMRRFIVGLANAETGDRALDRENVRTRK